eukprot:CAMPEP_0171354020 /NCGR_PEP_ID=MMETSP0878-20121228/44489_1 /TAXON_ID=67004 /ORGANISM="Thalassiosira weissflogii, Strain CCMP1336" /LENGTH=68 /DNA_ID=CAMNT_0011859977 /DNA_START=1590 /DNA_END=1799 /DNA_ORIENTATION=+
MISIDIRSLKGGDYAWESYLQPGRPRLKKCRTATIAEEDMVFEVEHAVISWFFDGYLWRMRRKKIWKS